MREIKFRVWDKFRKKLISNILTIKIDRVTEQPCLIVYTDKKINPHLEIREIDKIYCNEFELMQYTGLKDKNGKEIYEGDIVTVRHGNGYQTFEEDVQVIWDEYGFSPMIWQYRCDGCSICCEILEAEVIGNTYENPELLQEVEPWMEY